MNELRDAIVAQLNNIQYPSYDESDLGNVEMLCYNCYYLMVGDVFDNKQLEGLEDHKPTYSSQVDWELDEYTKQRLRSF